MITPESVLRASGHVAKFSDLAVRDSATGESFRLDALLTAELNRRKDDTALAALLRRVERAEVNDMSEVERELATLKVVSPKSGAPLSRAAHVNLMFGTNVGVHADTASHAYLRPETAQGIFANF